MAKNHRVGIAMADWWQWRSWDLLVHVSAGSGQGTRLQLKAISNKAGRDVKVVSSWYKNQHDILTKPKNGVPEVDNIANIGSSGLLTKTSKRTVVGRSMPASS